MRYCMFPLLKYFITVMSLLIFNVSALQASNINNSTSFVTQAKYRCEVATKDGFKPYPLGIDHFRMSPLHYGIADLYGDGFLDMLFGASDETFSIDRIAEGSHPTFVYEGNEERSRRPFQYAFYSQDDNFKLPKGTKYLNARTILTQDFNGDGIDDLALTIWGTDYEPYTPARNEILLSSPDGYKADYLPGPAYFNHGGGAGDIDGDGDVDIIMDGSINFSSGPLHVYLNDGLGNFSYNQINLNKNYTDLLALYDLDGDQKLDIVAAVEKHKGLQVFWGKGNGYFTPGADIFSDEDWLSEVSYKRGSKDTYTRFKSWLFRDPAIADIDNDGKINILIPGSVNDQERVYNVEFDGRRIVRATKLWEQDEELKRTIKLHWLTACKLNSDSYDLISEVFGQYHYENFRAGEQHDLSRADKLIFKNDGKGNFSFFKLENPDFLDEKYHDLIHDYAKFLGVSVTPYTPKQVYYPNNLDQQLRFRHPYYFEKRRHNFPYNTVPSITENRGIYLPNQGEQPVAQSKAKENDPNAVSDRVKAILKQIQSGD